MSDLTPLSRNHQDAQRPNRSGQPSALAGCLIILALSCLLDLFFYSGYYASDDTAYLAAAQMILTGRGFAPEPDLAHIRLAIVGWNALVGLIFGFNVPLIAGSYIVFHQVLNVLTLVLGRRLFDNRVGLLAAYFVATAPLAVTFSSTVLPDIPMSCFLVLSLLMFLWAYDLRAGDKPRRALAAILAAGVSVGLAYSTKEAALVALPFFLILWFCLEIRRGPLRRALVTGAFFALGFFLVFGAEWAILSYLTGHSYLRMGWTVGPENFTDILRTHKHGLYPLERLGWVQANLRPWFDNTRFDYILAGTALLYPFVPGRKLSIWGLAACYFAYHTWGSARLTEYLPPSLQARYFTLMLPLLFIAYGFIIVKLWGAVPKLVRKTPQSEVVQAIFMLVVLLHPLPGLHRSNREAGKVYWAGAVNTAVSAMQSGLRAGARPVVLSGLVTKRVELLLRTAPIEGVVLARRCRPDAQLREELLSDGFYYVEYYPTRRLDPYKRPDGFDPELHPLILAVPDEGLTPEPQDRLLGPVEIDGHRGILRRLQRFDGWHKRTERVAHAITPFAKRCPDRNAWSAYLYEWVPQSAAPQPGTD